MPPHRPESPPPPVETDPRFPSGPWQGFFLMAHWPGRHTMELHLTFHQGVMTGEGRDMIGPFLIRGKYNIDDGKCHWSKRYVGKHDVAYQGYNEGKGIWGVWEIPPTFRGGFHIWPTAMGDPTSPKLTEALDEPVEFQSVQEEGLQVEELQPAGTGVEFSSSQSSPATAAGSRGLASKPAPQILGKSFTACIAMIRPLGQGLLADGSQGAGNPWGNGMK
jgi:hypothetical protein